VRVRDEGDYSGQPFFVMDLATTSMDGVLEPRTAGTRLLRESPAVLLDLFRQACVAIAHLHGSSILHRDIKPSNILLSLDPPEPMRAMVADLGIAAHEDQQGSLTKTLEVVGSPAYRAPETVLPGGRTIQSDVYSLGKTLEAILTGRVPAQVGARPLPRHGALTEELWQALDSTISGACQFDASARYQDVAAFLEALPVPVLALGARSSTSLQVPAEPTLTSEAIAVLAEVIAAQGADNGAALWSLSNGTRLEKYYFSMGLQELKELGFLEYAMVEDQNGQWDGVRPTVSAYRWARNHPDEMREARSPTKESGNDDDIPF
jgi:serine/threonine protein kinase